MQQTASVDQAMRRKFPEAVVVAIAKDSQGKHNPITLGWVMVTSSRPPMLAIAVGHPRYSKTAIEHSREFVVSFVSSAMKDDALFHGTHSGRDMDKIADFGTKTSPAEKIDSVIFDDAVANFECVLESQLDTGDHTLFVGRVVAAHVNTDPEVRRLYTVGPGYEMGAVESV